MLEPSSLTFGDWITITEAAKMYGKNRATIYRHAGIKTSRGRVGRMKTRQIGDGTIQIYVPSLEALAVKMGWQKVGDQK